MTDMDFENGGAVVRIRPLSDSARAWIERYVDYMSAEDGAFVIETREAEKIAAAARQDGFDANYPSR